MMISVSKRPNSQAVDTLRREHSNMRSVLVLIGRQLDLLEVEAHTDTILLVNAIYYMRKFPSLVHHPKEDAIFQWLVHLDPAWKDEVARLREQHGEIYRLEDWLIETLLDNPKPSRELRDRLVEMGREYLTIQRKHSETEERVLFPQALLTFQGRDWAMINSRFTEVDDPLFGEHSGERYHLLYEHLMREAANG